MDKARSSPSGHTAGKLYPSGFEAFQAWNEKIHHTQAMVGRDLPDPILMGNEFWIDSVEVGDVGSLAPPAAPLPTSEEFLEQENLKGAVFRVHAIADRVFEGAVEDPPSLEVEYDPVLGGLYVLVSVQVLGLDREDYRHKKALFDKEVSQSVSPEKLARMVVYPYLNVSPGV